MCSETMGEETSLQNSDINQANVDNSHAQEEQFSSEPVCTVILDSSDVTYIPVFPLEAVEEIVLYNEVKHEVEEEINVETNINQDIYNNVYNNELIISSGKKTHKKDSKPGPHKCKLCPKTFSQGINLATHIRTHTGEKPFKCKVCSKPFSQQPNLWKHMRTHTGERPYQCGICKKSFTQQANLTKHVRIHTGERPYSCQYCGKRFTQQANLTKHVRLHTGERPFHCNYCTKTFVQQSNLDRHERTHTGVKPFKCKICCDSFAQNAHLSKHIRTIHKNTDISISGRKCEEGSTVSEINSKQNVILSNHFEGNSKTFGIPVLYCTKTGKILKRIGY